MNVKKIIELRQEKNLSRYALADLSGIPKATLRDIEKGTTKNPRIETVKAIAKALDVDINEIV